MASGAQAPFHNSPLAPFLHLPAQFPTAAHAQQMHPLQHAQAQANALSLLGLQFQPHLNPGALPQASQPMMLAEPTFQQKVAEALQQRTLMAAMPQAAPPHRTLACLQAAQIRDVDVDACVYTLQWLFLAARAPLLCLL